MFEALNHVHWVSGFHFDASIGIKRDPLRGIHPVDESRPIERDLHH
jgi:hypothetical protein